MTIQQLLAAAREQYPVTMSALASDVPLLLAYTLQQPRSYLHAWPEQTVTEDVQQQFRHLFMRHLQGEPLAYLTGSRAFWSLDLAVTTDTLIPRPETELLVELVLAKGKGRQCQVADLGTGSGAIALSLASEHHDWSIVATDISEQALNIAKKNAAALNLQQVAFYQGDWCQALPHQDFDFIISNPPYLAEIEWAQYAPQLAFEPRVALLSGEDGLDAMRVLIASAKQYLKLDGWLLLEHGYSQGNAVRELFKQANYGDVHTINDLAGKERVTIGHN